VFRERYGLGPYITEFERVYSAVRTMSLYKTVFENVYSAVRTEFFYNRG
jgi:hypothetical protein